MRLMFVIPVHGRLELATVCLRQLERTCDALQEEGVCASAILVGESRELRALRRPRFGFVIRDNQFLGRRFNDGMSLACDPRYNAHPADYVVPLGSDDWVDHRLFLEPPPPDTLVGFQTMAFVKEDGTEISTVQIRYLGGSGIRIIPRQLIAPLGYRPCDEDRRRACDTSILHNLRHQHGDQLRVEHRHLHGYQIVDWKTPDAQLNTYKSVTRLFHGRDKTDPFQALSGIYPDEALDEMATLYGARVKVLA